MAIEGVSATGLEAQSSQTDAVKSLIRWESPHPLSIAGVRYLMREPCLAPQEGRMAERRTRRSFTREFKAQAVKRLLDGGKGLSDTLMVWTPPDGIDVPR